MNEATWLWKKDYGMEPGGVKISSMFAQISKKMHIYTYGWKLCITLTHSLCSYYLWVTGRVLDSCCPIS